MATTLALEGLIRMLEGYLTASGEHPEVTVDESGIHLPQVVMEHLQTYPEMESAPQPTRKEPQHGKKDTEHESGAGSKNLEGHAGVQRGRSQVEQRAEGDKPGPSESDRPIRSRTKQASEEKDVVEPEKGKTK